MYGCHVTLDRFRKSQKDTTLTDIRLSLTLTIKISIFITKKNGGISKIVVKFFLEILYCDSRLIDIVRKLNFWQKFDSEPSLGMGGQTSPSPPPIFKIALKNYFASIPSD